MGKGAIEAAWEFVQACSVDADGIAFRKELAEEGTWCAEEEVPTAANLNLYRGWQSCVGWHFDDEPLFGKCGDAKLIVSVSLGSSVLFRWRR